MDARAISGPTIILRSGNYFDLQDPSASRGDVSTPLKSLLPDYKSVEHRVEQAVWSRLGLPPTLPPSVKVADRRALAVEQRVCMGNGDDWGYGEPTDDDCALIRFLSPEDARAAFFARYHYIRCAS